MAVGLCVYERSGKASALAGWCWQGELVPTPLKNGGVFCLLHHHRTSVPSALSSGLVFQKAVRGSLEFIKNTIKCRKTTTTKSYKQKTNHNPTCSPKTLASKWSIFPRLSQNTCIESLCFVARPTNHTLFILLNSLRQSGCRFQSKWMCVCACVAFLLQGHSSCFLFSVSPKISFFLS